MERSKTEPGIPAGGCLLLEHEVRVPFFVRDFASFRCWARSDEFPERGRIDFVGGDLEVDMSPEDLGTHADPKAAIGSTLYFEVESRDLGRLWVDGVLLSNEAADLSCEPDVLLCLWETLASGRTKLVEKAGGREGRYVELLGTADLVVEVVSDSSVRKDTDRLLARYFTAGVREYWIVDARGKTLRFSVYTRGPRRFRRERVDTRGFARSPLLERRVKLSRKPARLGFHRYKLELTRLVSSGW